MDELTERTTRSSTEQSDPYYATARLWDDGIIEPQDTRDVTRPVPGAGRRPTPREDRLRPVFRM